MPKEQHEEEAILRFATYLRATTGIGYGVTGRDVPVASGQNYDYELTRANGDKLAVELFRLIESEEDFKRQRAWGRVIEKLKQEVAQRKLKGYMVSTPVFTYRKRDLDAYVSQQANAIENAISNDGDKEQFSAGGYEFNKIANLETILFSYSPGARAINPSGTALEQFARLLPVKNGQLEAPGHSRCLLVANSAIFVDPGDAIKALTNVDFSTFPNIDLIFYETTPGEFSVIFSRSVYEAIREPAEVTDPRLIPLRNQCLRFMLADKKNEAFEYIKAMSTASGNMGWLDDPEARMNAVMHVEARLKEYDQPDEALWLLEMLHDDPSPGAGGMNDPEDLHARVLRGDDVRFITTVRGHLCWLMSHLIARNVPEHYKRILQILDRYASEENLYIRTQVTFPLAEFVSRRRATRNQDGTAFDWDRNERQHVRDLAFRMLRENERYPRVMEGLLHVFNSLRDVDETEAEEILTRFLATRQEYVLHNLAALVVFFALFRDSHWQNEARFDRQKFVEILKQQIVRGDSSIRASIAWHLWKILQDKHLPYREVKEYFPLFWDGAYDSHVISMCAIAIEGLSTIAPSDALELFKRMVRKTLDNISQSAGRNFWLSSAEKMIPLFAQQPDDLVAIVSDLRDLWIKGAYIGDPTVIFMSFTQVDPARRDEVRRKFQAIHAEMKAVHPRLADVPWGA
ncbi:MAG TPA: hypothetical protein VMH04_24605 [Candidatus Solibacter sp.]|nr:hypothetical protein [Candidatus Solibacter sp.]